MVTGRELWILQNNLLVYLTKIHLYSPQKSTTDTLTPSMTITRSASRCSTIESMRDIFKSVSFKMQMAKFHKVFTGLSKMNLNKCRSGVYGHVTILKKSNMLSVWKQIPFCQYYSEICPIGVP